jgi:hypothetical protein
VELEVEGHFNQVRCANCLMLPGRIGSSVSFDYGVVRFEDGAFAQDDRFDLGCTDSE